MGTARPHTNEPGAHRQRMGTQPADRIHRARRPIHRIERPGYQPFWAVIGHDAVLDIERRPAEFTNGPIPILGSDAQLSMRAAGGAEIRTLIHMDEPDHAKYRKLTNDWFKPASIRRLTDRLDELSRQAVDKLEV